ncbi:MAG: hypothetical protein KKC51_05000, partial [Verrucomicrobia bacterium]|nr:hypothetical protein [Verrucomicrobiota bacterium]
NRIPLNKFEDFFREHRVDLSREDDLQLLKKEFNCYNMRACDIIRDLIGFTRLEPRLPSDAKDFRAVPAIELKPGMGREDIAAYLESKRLESPVADLAFYAYRDLSRCDWAPFVKAAIERSPISLHQTKDLEDDQVVAWLEAKPNESIYDGTRVAQPDEVTNFGRGDGLEKALCLANIWKARRPEETVELVCAPDHVSLRQGARRVEWSSAKGLKQQMSF